MPPSENDRVRDTKGKPQTPDEPSLEREDRREPCVDRRRRQTFLVAEVQGQELLRNARNQGYWGKERVEGTEVHEFGIPMATQVPQFANSVATHVVEADVVASPQEGVGWHGDDDVRAWFPEANECGEGCHVVIDMLQNVKSGDKVERTVGERHAAREGPVFHGHRWMSIPRNLDSGGMRLERRHVADSLEIGQIATGATASLDDSGVGRQSNPVKQPCDHSSSADEPPVPALVVRHHLIGGRVQLLAYPRDSG
jgi:hypothetical protein